MRNKGDPFNRKELLTVEEEVALIKRIQNSEEDSDDALQKLMYGNLRFVRAIARRYVCVFHTLDKLIEEGNIGLIHAVKKYDPTRGFKFISYAAWWIEQSIKQYIENNTIK